MSNYSILVVDDEPDNFEVIETFLASQNYTLHYASRGRSAIADLDKYNPDAILLDVMMPEMDGLEVCQRIKSMAQWQAVPIIMVTALAGKADLARCLAAGADDFICKPVNSVELQARVQSMLRLKKQHDRIQSLSKLQRNNIHSLENSLNEFRLDLAAEFPTELSVALESILANIGLAQEHLDNMPMPMPELRHTLESIDRSALNLDKLHQTFLFYLQFTLTAKDHKKHQICAPKMLIEQIATLQSRQFKLLSKLVFDLEDPEIAVTPQHLQYIVTELLDCALNAAKSAAPICVHGRVIDNAFHFWIDDKEKKSINSHESKLSELIQFDDGSADEKELKMGLKIVKKIVEIYDGLFLITNSDRASSIVYVTLPLAMSANPQQLLVNN